MRQLPLVRSVRIGNEQLLVSFEQLDEDHALTVRRKRRFVIDRICYWTRNGARLAARSACQQQKANGPAPDRHVPSLALQRAPAMAAKGI
jgi:hypothetical protein